MLYKTSNLQIILNLKIKVPLIHIRTAPEKCPPRRENEAPEDESGLDGFTLLASTHWVSHFPSLKEK